jgi:hypothetical protein
MERLARLGGSLDEIEDHPRYNIAPTYIDSDRPLG